MNKKAKAREDTVLSELDVGVPSLMMMVFMFLHWTNEEKYLPLVMSIKEGGIVEDKQLRRLSKRITVKRFLEATDNVVDRKVWIPQVIQDWIEEQRSS